MEARYEEAGAVSNRPPGLNGGEWEEWDGWLDDTLKDTMKEGAVKRRGLKCNSPAFMLCGNLWSELAEKSSCLRPQFLEFGCPFGRSFW